MVTRRGMSLLEVAVAGIVLVAMLTVCLQLFRAMASQRRGLEARRMAIQEVGNVMERLCARPWEELTPEAVGQVQLSADASRALSGGELQIDVLQPGDDPGEKRITVVLRWPSGPERPDLSVRLVAWRYRGSDD